MGSDMVRWSVLDGRSLNVSLPREVVSGEDRGDCSSSSSRAIWKAASSLKGPLKRGQTNGSTGRQ